MCRPHMLTIVFLILLFAPLNDHWFSVTACQLHTFISWKITLGHKLTFINDRYFIVKNYVTPTYRKTEEYNSYNKKHTRRTWTISLMANSVTKDLLFEQILFFCTFYSSWKDFHNYSFFKATFLKNKTFIMFVYIQI